MTKHKLEVQDPGGCICFAPPCVCSAGPDCTQAQ